MTYKQFKMSCDKLKKFMKEQEKLDAVIKVISPTSTGVVEFGNEFIDDYSRVVEIGLNDQCNWFAWFVFDNDFGKKKMEIRIDGKKYIIENEQIFYDVCVKPLPPTKSK